MEIRSSFDGARDGLWGERREDVRYYFIVEPREEEDGYFGDGGKEGVGGPDLMAEEGEIFCWWDDANFVS